MQLSRCYWGTRTDMKEGGWCSQWLSRWWGDLNLFVRCICTTSVCKCACACVRQRHVTWPKRKSSTSACTEHSRWKRRLEKIFRFDMKKQRAWGHEEGGDFFRCQKVRLLLFSWMSLCFSLKIRIIMMKAERNPLNDQFCDQICVWDYTIYWCCCFCLTAVTHGNRH